MRQVSVAACGCGKRHDAVRSLDRRALLAGLVVAPCIAIADRVVAQDLIDPTTLKSSRVSSPTDLAPNSRPEGRLDPDYARGMASSVTGALISLIRAYGNIANQVGTLTAKEKELSEKLAAAVRDKAAKLDEYRQGLFCSGCNQTKSEILAKGEQFPHPGQHIIQPSAEQIAAKERELQANIDRLAAELKKTTDARRKADQDINAIRSEIFTGMALWRTAVSFERRLVRQRDADDEDAYQRERAKITQQLTVAQRDLALAKTVPPLRRGIDELVGWGQTLERVEDRRGRERAANSQRLANTDTTARREAAEVQTVGNQEAAKITAFGLAGYLQIVAVPMNAAADPGGIGGEASGHNFRMGKYDQESVGQILPNVAIFVGRARNTVFQAVASTAGPADAELARNERAIASARRALLAATAEEDRLKAAAELKRQQAEEARKLAEAEAAERQNAAPPAPRP